MGLTQISTGGVKDDAVTAGKIPANAVGSSEIADDAVDQGAIADDAVDEARLQISNAGSNGQFLSKQSGNTGGLTWATPPDTNTQVGGATGVDFNDNAKARFGTGNDLEVYHDGSHSILKNSTGFLALASDSFVLENNARDENLIVASANGSVDLMYDNVKKIETTAAGITVTGTVTDSKGNLRSIPRDNKSSAYVLVATDAGKCISITSGGITINTSIFSNGDAVTILNHSGSDQTITAGSGFALFNSADATTGNRTLAGRGMCTVYFVANDTAYVSGAGLS